MAGKGTPATVVLDREGVAHVLHAYEVPADHPGGYGEAGAAALGVEPERMFKTLLADLDGELVVGVVPVAGSLDLKALATALGGKRAAMAEPARAERATGMVVGGISPLGHRAPHRTAVDETVELWDTVHVSAGRRGLSLEIAPGDLLRLTGAVLADLAR
ncbi:MAG: aminoacyl-tRNA deacylase [Mycobacteriales bacterium]|nr:aminoacyl-tRNA deacylase [Mycobacteriales bacterium]